MPLRHVPILSKTGRNKTQYASSNLEFSRWASILGDANMAAAIIDRTIHHGRILNFTGTSWPLSHSTMK
ncbi:ATP-binding protein [Trueperella pyogenes]